MTPTLTPTKRKIEASEAFFVRLGAGNSYAAECIKNGYIVLSYRECPHELCQADQWDEIRSRIQQGKINEDIKAVNALKNFYKAPETTLWIMFHDNALWWAFAKPGIIEHPERDGEQIRQTVDGWHNTNANGALLTFDKISSLLTSVKGFRATLCSIRQEKFSYLLRLLNAESSPVLAEIDNAKQSLQKAAKLLIPNLHEQDMEVLVDLIAREKGWFRISCLGKTKDTYDLICQNREGEKIGIQVKTESSYGYFEKFYNKTVNTLEFEQLIFVAHTLSESDRQKIELLITGDSRYKLWTLDTLVETLLQAPLLNWLMLRAVLE